MSWWSPPSRASSTTRSSATGFPSTRPSPARCFAPERRTSGRRPGAAAVRARGADERAERALRPASRPGPLAGRPRSVRPPSRRPRFTAWDQQVLSGFAASAATAVGQRQGHSQADAASEHRVGGARARPLGARASRRDAAGARGPEARTRGRATRRRRRRPRRSARRRRRTHRLRHPGAATDHRRPASRGPRRPRPRAGAGDAGGASPSVRTTRASNRPGLRAWQTARGSSPGRGRDLPGRAGGARMRSSTRRRPA